MLLHPPLGGEDGVSSGTMAGIAPEVLDSGEGGARWLEDGGVAGYRHQVAEVGRQFDQW
jgi:hypothetical protein